MQTQTVFGIFGATLMSVGLALGCAPPDDDLSVPSDLGDDVATTRAPLIGHDSPDTIPGHYIVVFKDRVAAHSVSAAANRIALRADSRITRQYSVIPAFAAELSATDLDALRDNADVAYIEADRTVEALAIKPSTSGLARHDDCPADNDGSFDDHGCNGSGVRLYVIDTGIRATHNEFTGRVATGADFVGDGQGTNDCNGHGTHVASVAAGTRFGMAAGATIVPVRVLNCFGSGSTASVIAGVNFVASDCGRGRCVANMSLGGSTSQALNDAVNNTIKAGIPFAVAAGASLDPCLASPASVPAALTVGGAGATGYPGTTGSNSIDAVGITGACIDLFASSTDIIGADNSSDSATRTLSGTSVASPHVAGAVAQLLDCQPGLSVAGVAAQVDAKAIAGAMLDEGLAEDFFLCSDFTSATSSGACDCSVVPDNSCEGRCDGAAPLCFCDLACRDFGDCCPDVTTFCPILTSCVETGSCGGQAPGGCFCDPACTTVGDCCDDGPC